jgi:glycosyltransferase involved in cell wall biosynthesis
MQFTSQKQKPKFSIIVPTYNHLDDCLRPCIESLLKTTDMSTAEIIVVANGCVDGTRDFLNSLGDQIKTIWIDEPAGYTCATNAGIRAASGDYIVLLNNDVTIFDVNYKNFWLEILLRPFQILDKVGITGPAKDYHCNTNHDFLLFFAL